MTLVKTLMPILLSVFFLCVGNSMLLGLMTLMAEKYSWSGSYVGGLLSIKGVLAVLTAVFLPFVAHRFKLLTSMTAHFTFLIIIAISLLFLQNQEIMWSVLYALTIISTTFYFINMETIIISDVDSKEMARGLSLYWLLALAGGSVGPWLSGIIGLNSISFFVVAIFFIISYMVIFSKRHIDEEHIEEIPFSQTLHFIKKFPLIWAICFVSGYTGESLYPFLGVLGLKLGLTGEQSLNLMSFFLIGGVIMQYATGWLIDHLGVHRMTIYTSAISILIGVLLVFTTHSYVFLSITTIACGAACFGVSLLALATIGVMFKEENKLLVVSIQIIFYDLGNVIGNALNGISMDMLGYHGFIYVAIAFLTITTIVGVVHNKGEA